MAFFKVFCDSKLDIFSFSFPFSRFLYSKFCKELVKCEDAPEKLASCFLSAVSLHYNSGTQCKVPCNVAIRVCAVFSTVARDLMTRRNPVDSTR